MWLLQHLINYLITSSSHIFPVMHAARVPDTQLLLHLFCVSAVSSAASWGKTDFYCWLTVQSACWCRKNMAGVQIFYGTLIETLNLQAWRHLHPQSYQTFHHLLSFWVLSNRVIKKQQYVWNKTTWTLAELGKLQLGKLSSLPSLTGTVIFSLKSKLV